MRVRPATAGDTEAIRAAVSRAREDSVFDDLTPPPSDVSPAGIREALEGAACPFVLVDDARPVGVAAAHPDDTGTEAELLALWVHPEHAADGATATLLSRVASALAARGVETIRASVPADDTRLRSFYETQGFNRRTIRRGPVGEEAVVTASVDAV